MPIVSSSPVLGTETGPSGGTFLSGATTGVPPATPLIAHVVTTFSEPYGTVPNDIQALVTNSGRTLIARMMVEGLAFRITGFAVGTSGYDVSDPTQSTGPPPGATALGSQVFPTSGQEPIDLVEFPNTGAVSFLCRLETTEALAGLGELGLFATILDSPSNPSEVGDVFLFALAHFPLQGKTDNHVFVQRIVVQF